MENIFYHYFDRGCVTFYKDVYLKLLIMTNYD